MKIIMLDFDGVLNSMQSRIYNDRNNIDHEKFCPIAVSNLQHLLDLDSDIYLVITSTWRIGRTVGELSDILEANGIDGDRLLHVTPHTKGTRGSQIQEWLDRRSDLYISHYCILDDEDDMDHLSPHLVKTLSGNGFMWYEMIQVAKMLDVKIDKVWL